ncbi:diacylglycerol kinase [Oceaniferula spumae]|uniref:Diacylglycerol kinase n=1 Tax=Oceaniferula spumae TaxID=2979115 RepID=A0AAT9FKD1_9BACT
MRKFLVIVNMESGTAKKSDPGKITAEVLDVLSSHDIESDVRFFRGADLVDGLRRAIDEKPDAILVAGGDGTVNTAAGLMENSGVALGILPMGTFNLAARDYDVPLEFEPALHALATAEMQSNQLMKISGLPCLCTSIIGFYPRMARMIDEYHGKKWWRKSLRVLGWSVFRFAKSTVYRLTISNQDTEETKQHAFKSRMLAIVPGEYRDTLGLIPERKSTSGKEATVYVFQHLTRIAMLRGMLAYVLGQSSDDPDMEAVAVTSGTLDFKGKKHVKIMIDGEVTQLETPLKIEIVPDALLLLHPQPETLP